MSRKVDLNKLTPEDWSILKELLTSEIDRIDKLIASEHAIIDSLNDDQLKTYGEEKNLRNFYIILRDKIEWIRSGTLVNS